MQDSSSSSAASGSLDNEMLAFFTTRKVGRGG